MFALLLSAACGGGGGGGGSSDGTGSGTDSGGSANRADIGIDIGSANDYETNRIFADVMKTSRSWRDTSWTNDLANLDSNGWPQQDAAICVWAGIDKMQGTYALSFSGKASIAAPWGGVAILDQSYDATSNLSSAKLVFSRTDDFGLLLVFTNTQRTATSPTNTGITRVELKRPRSVGSSESYGTEVFTSAFRSALAPFSVLRTMDFSATNSNGAVDWSDRTRPGHASQAVGNPSAPSGGWQGRGGAWEYAVLLANQTGKDLWINVPVGASDDYITKLARLMRYGSDGRDPYTGTQPAPVWPGLAPGRKLYVEFSNELWNTGADFRQSQANLVAARAEVRAGGSPLDFDGNGEEWIWAWRRTAKRTVDVSNIFRAVWGDAAMMTQVRPVLMSQLGYADGPLLQAMRLLVDYYGNPARVASPRLPSHYIYGLGGSAYYSPTDASSVGAVFSTIASGFETALQADADWALAFGLKRIAYEGGPSLDATGNAGRDANLAAAWADPRMTELITTQHATWSRSAGDLLVYYSLAGNFQWGFMRDVLSPGSAKMTGIAGLNAASPAPSAYGTPIPATLAATSAAVPPAWAVSGTTLSQRSWLGYPVLVSREGRFRITLTASAASSAQAEILVDGSSIGTVTLSGSAASPALTTPTLPPGSHGIVVRNAAGSFDLSQIEVQAE